MADLTEDQATLIVSVVDEATQINAQVLASPPAGTEGAIVTRNIPSGTQTVADTSDGSATGGARGTTSQLSGGVYNSTLPTLTTGQQAGLQLDANGRLLVDTTLSEDQNWGTVDSTTLRTAAEIGNATGAADFNNGATGAQTLRVAANQGAPNTVANAWPTQITDGTNSADVTEASTAAVAGDSALVVALSPNTPLPAGTNALGSITVSNFETDDLPATQTITAEDVASTTTLGFNNQPIITGTPTAGSVASFVISSEETVRVQVTGTWTGSLQSEGSLDGGVTWYLLAVHFPGTSFSNAVMTANFSGSSMVAGLTNYRLRATTAWTGTATVRVVESINASSAFIINPVSPNLGVLKTYSASATVASAALATDIFTISGSATKTVVITVFVISGTATTSQVVNMVITKRSTVDTGGTPTTITTVPSDSQNAAATAVVTSYAGVPTVGTAVGMIRNFKLFVSAPSGGAAGSPSAPIIFPATFAQSITLRGTGETLAFNLGGVTVAGGSFDISVEWVEF